ncbi:TonB-dependent receptor [Sediminibacterium goheungense]|uniref:Outer membrane receptor for ferrienterochelin and colicins n=1 Tax=Sediminibacterium goheungense TaxID=1086393 RepID=A0A4R6J1P3_9BACT|nr:TonB-dependent receptor [Sediminibacterium goheungense]TDO29154.1 outer membrane receptor for ferrienterochelin and colicins [Sediminibacterium goheungense]
MKGLLSIFLIFLAFSAQSQQVTVAGRITASGKGIANASIRILNGVAQATSDSSGFYTIFLPMQGSYTLVAEMVGYESFRKKILAVTTQTLLLDIVLKEAAITVSDVVVTGTLKEVRKMESPVPVEVFTPAFFRKNPTPNIFDALQQVNGVRPQLNCNICNTGDIHINGLEGPYTMVLIDGMPIVSSLSTVYGLSGIPNALIERVEIVKGPASSLYGSEAVGGLINIITKNTAHAARLYADYMHTSWNEKSADLGFAGNPSKKIAVLTGLNGYLYDRPIDKNKDGFTDVTLQKRLSVFQKWSVTRKENRLFSFAARYYHEDRWGGDMRWNKSFRGGDSIYGESIYTSRWELTGQYQLPTREKILYAVSYNSHQQDSRYGTTSYIANQQIFFQQLTWDKKAGIHDLLTGAALRYTYYDDNTPATASADPLNPKNEPQQTWLPGIFVQDEMKIGRQQLLLGLRYDRHSIHGNIITPRIAYKLTLSGNEAIRLNAGTGFRVVNLFTEDHAALTGARKTVIRNELKPERSYNINLNYSKKRITGNGTLIGLEVSVWYTHFSNRIIGDYETNPNEIIYDNLQGYSVSKGITVNTDFSFLNGIKAMAGFTLQDVSLNENGIKTQQILTEKITGTWSVSYKINPWNLAVDYTGNFYGPMRLPLLGPLDPRKPYSPVWSLQNIQFTFSGWKQIAFYGGVKNLLNWTPNKGNPFLIARTHDPFDKKVQYDTNGQIKATTENPYALSFDPTYVYAPNQGRRIFIGIRVSLK